MKIHPLISLFSSIIIMIFGLIYANNFNTLYWLLGIYILFIIFGMYKSALKMIIPAGIFIFIFTLIIYLTTKDTDMMLRMTIRFLAIFISLIPASSIYIVDFTTSLNQIHTPRFITIGLMITFSFIPILKIEMKRIREAMKSRGIAIYNPKIMYRAFIIPLVMRITEISDTLSLSLETRGFKMTGNDYSIYKPIKLKILDLFYVLLISVSIALLIIFKG